MRRQPCAGAWPNDQDLDDLDRVQQWHSCELRDGHAGACHCPCDRATS